MNMDSILKSHVIYRGTAQFSKSFGNGWYCRFNKDLAREYGHINKYEIDFKDLKILDLRKENIMDWMSIVTMNRNLIVRDCVFSFNNIDISEYDVIIGYRSDNSNLVALKQCLAGTITRTTLLEILLADERNIEICLRTSKAKSKLEFKRVIPRNSAKPIDDIETRHMLNVSDSYLFELTKVLSEYFACFVECGKSYDDAYRVLIESGIYKKLHGRFIAGNSGSDLYMICTGNNYKSCKIDHYDFWLSNLISRYVISNGYELDIFRNKGISMEQLIMNQDIPTDMVIN